MKIVDEDVSALKRASCRGCGAVLEYGASEVQSRHGTDYSGGPDGEEWIVCPRCGRKVVLRAW